MLSHSLQIANSQLLANGEVFGFFLFVNGSEKDFIENLIYSDDSKNGFSNPQAQHIF
jgi:hypothetical protein